MKRIFKIIWTLALAAAAAACGKSEVTPAGDDTQREITFTVAPVVKADGHAAFDKNLKFYVQMFYAPDGKSWDADRAELKTYGSGYVSYQTDAWRFEKGKYFWPKSGSITFLAYDVLSCAVTDADPASATYGKQEYSFGNLTGFYTNVTQGVYTYDKYDVTAAAKYNADFIIADPVKDQKTNTDSKYYTTGVPVLFKHGLSKLLFTARTDKDYSAETDLDITFTVDAIIFKGLKHQGNFYQLGSGWDVDGSSVKDQTYYDSRTEDSEGNTVYDGFKVTDDTSEQKIYSTDGQYFYMPQTFALDGTATDAIELHYTVVTRETNSAGETLTDTDHRVTTVSLNSATGTKLFEKWEMGKLYTVNLIFSLDEIYWVPQIQDWDKVNLAETELK